MSGGGWLLLALLAAPNDRAAVIILRRLRMLENEYGTRLSGFGNGRHWRVFRALLNEVPLWNPLRAEVQALVNASVATHGPGHQATIDSTAAGPSVFGHLATDWEATYERWLADLHRRDPEVPFDVEARQVEGMAIWHVLAELRPDERWLAPAYRQPPRIYRLLEILRRATG
jgi:hypothetical protein